MSERESELRVAVVELLIAADKAHTALMTKGGHEFTRLELREAMNRVRPLLGVVDFGPIAVTTAPSVGQGDTDG